MLDRALVFILGLAVGGPVMSYIVAHTQAAAQPQVVTQYVTVIRRVPVPVAQPPAPMLQLAAYSSAGVAGAALEAVPGVPGQMPGPAPKPELVARDEAENRMLQCITPKMRAVFDKVEEQFGQRFKVISTCNHSTYVAGTNRVSWHVSGNAVDFQVPADKRYDVLAWLAKNHTTGLTMTYNDSTHIHIDVGGYVHLALAGRDKALGIPGARQPARYVSTRRHRQTYEADDDDSN